MTSLTRWAGAAFRGIVYLFLTLPAAIAVCSSVSETDYLTFPPKGFTLAWYRRAFDSKPFMDSLLLSTELALAATALALIIGTMAAYAVDRHPFPGRALFVAAVLSPMILPAVVIAIALLHAMIWLGLGQSFWGLLVGHVVISVPYVMRIMTASLATFDRTLEEAAMNLRAGPWRTVRRVTLPMLLPGLVSSAVFAFVTSFGNVTVSVFLGGLRTTTLPIQIFTSVEFSYEPVLAAISTLVIAITVAVLLLVERIVGMERLV